MTDRIPERFVAVVGAPRSGTTSLADFLKRHRDVTFSTVKEPHFFSQFDLTGCSDTALREMVIERYLVRYFPKCRPWRSTLAEGSVSYLYRAEQMVPILRMWPQAKFIIALRDPIELLPSLHQRLLYLGDEVVKDFARAWALAAERREGRKIPRTSVDARWLQYDEIGRLGKYVDRFISVVGRERCLIVLFDDLTSDPASVYRQVLRFVDLPDDGRQDFRPCRASRGYRFGFLQRLLKRPPKVMRGIVGGEQYRQRVKGLGHPDGSVSKITQAILAGRKRLLRWNRAEAPPLQLSDAVRRTIKEELEEDVAHLSRIIDRDLSHWLQPFETSFREQRTQYSAHGMRSGGRQRQFS